MYTGRGYSFRPGTLIVSLMYKIRVPLLKKCTHLLIAIVILMCQQSPGVVFSEFIKCL